MTKSNSNYLVWILLCAFAGLLGGCSLSYHNLEFKRGEKSEKREKFKSAVKHYGRVVKRDPESSLGLEAARRAGRLSLLHTKDFNKAIGFYRNLVLYSTDPRERMEAQERIAATFFEKINDYESAITEYNKLLVLEQTPEKMYQYKMAIARSYFYLKNFFQSHVEVDNVLGLEIDAEEKFQSRLFKANIYLTSKDADKAIPIYRALVKEYPELSQKEKVPLSIVSAYEEVEDYKSAIEELRGMLATYPFRDYIELRIKKLEELRMNQPGASGLRK